MSQKIKKQFRRSLPIFLILCLINLSVSSLFFNWDFKVSRLANKIGFSFEKPEVSAQNDAASTTVTVRNAEPTWAVQAAEVPASTSTSPVNVGGSIGFSGTGSDPEGNSYYLIICATAGATTTAGNPPECTGTRFCRSGAPVANGVEATCTYSNVADPLAETDDWYAYLCDNHPSEPECSAVSQGSAVNNAASSSPMYINHAPSFTNAYTSLDNRDPGQSFTVTASTSDNDVTGGQDVVSLYVCDTNSWATSTGCAGTQLCMGTSSVANVSCTFPTVAPIAHGAWNYFAFVKDWHDMPAAANSRTSTYNVNDVAPVVSGVIFNGSSNVTVNMKGVSEVAASSSAQVTDNNGCLDIVSATSTLYWENAVGANDCALNDNDCYHIPSGSCAVEVGSCTGANDAALNYTCSTTMAYHTKPSDATGGNPAAATTWLAALTAQDGSSRHTAISAVGRDVNTTMALSISETTIPYGSIKSNYNSGSFNATTTVVNYGNSPLDSTVNGTDMTGPGVIEAANQEYNTVNFTYSAGIDLSSTTPVRVNIDVARPTSAADISGPIYWGIGIPAGRPSGNYSGTNVFYAAVDDSGSGW